MNGTRLRRFATLTLDPGPDEVLPFVNLELVSSGGGRLLDEPPTRRGAEAGTALARRGDVLFGKLRPYLAKSWLVDRECFASTELLCMRPSSALKSHFLGYVVQSQPFVDWAVATSEGVKMPRTSWEAVGDFVVDLPSPQVQQAIADYLDAETARIDALIEKKRRMIELLEERFWVRFCEDVRNVPTMSLGRTLTFLTDGPFGSAFTSNDYSDDGAAVVRLGNIGFARYRSEEQRYIPLELFETFRRHEVRSGDLLIAGLGDDRNHAGRACVAPDLGPAMVKGKCYCARVNPMLAVPEFLALVMSSPLGSESFGEARQGSTRAMINLGVVRATRLPVPSVESQREIVDGMSRARQLTSASVGGLDRQIALLTEHRQALVTAAVTGELLVPEAVA